MGKWPIIENIVIYLVIGVVLIWVHNPWVLLLLMFVNYRKEKPNEQG